MPLDKYTKLAMDGLKRGDVQVASGVEAELLQKLEKEGFD